MVKFSNDSDILKYEPVLFGELHLPGQVLVKGTGATLEETTLADAASDFVAAGIEPGGVVHMRSADGLLDGAYEIVSVDSAAQLTVSVIRSDTTAEPVAPGSAVDISYRIGTFAPQAAEAAFQLTEYFGIQPGNPQSDITIADIADTEVLRRACVFAVISAVYALWAGHNDSQGLWSKSLHYKQLFEKARQRCRLPIDLGSDGIADLTHVGGSLRLIRD
jgi:hypothetical protein